MKEASVALLEQIAGSFLSYRWLSPKAKPWLRHTRIITSTKCPTCRYKSTNIHDSYTTKIQDLPIQSKTVYLNLLIRRFKCQNPDCSKKTFSETFPFRERNARKTTRLMKLIVDLAESRSSVGMTKDLEEMGIIVRKSSLCNYLGQKKNSRRL
ncbi:transposase family protein [Enterococcus sp. DIV0187]|uniref:transposase family protein n=1 Tax=Enterococcus sp. DIV0187 TaxID=2774644 RepID=UPI003F684766